MFFKIFNELQVSGHEIVASNFVNLDIILEDSYNLRLVIPIKCFLIKMYFVQLYSCERIFCKKWLSVTGNRFSLSF